MATTLLEFFERDQEFLHKDALPIGYDCWNDINTRTTRHTQFGDFGELYEISRPHEEPIYTQWREDNRRHITSGHIDRFVSMMTRVVKYSVVDYKELGMDDDFVEVIESNPFYVDGIEYEFEEFRKEVLLPLSFEDPNAVIVEFPRNPDNDRITPIIQTTKGSDPIISETLYIPFYDIKYAPTKECEAYVWHGGEVNLGTEKEPSWTAYFYGVDKEAYWVMIPYKIEEETHYRIEPWYTHELGELPVTKLPSRVKTKKVDGTLVKYGSSFIMGALPYFDEAVIRLSQDQVNMIRHLDPRFWMKGDVDCPDCNGSRKIQKNIAGFGSTLVERECTTCAGSGKMPAQMGAFSTYRFNDNHIEGQNSGAPMGYVTPPTGNLDISNRSWQEWVQMGVDVLAIDPVGGTPNESGEAKKMRQLVKEDMINDYGDKFVEMSQSILDYKFKVLKQENAPKIPKPSSYNTKNANQLEEEYINAPKVIKHEKFMEWIRVLHVKDEKKIALNHMVSVYAPLVHYENVDVSLGINTAYAPIDIVRRDYAYIIFQDLLKDYDGDTELDEGQLRIQADQWLIDKGIVAVQDPVQEGFSEAEVSQEQIVDTGAEIDDPLVAEEAGQGVAPTSDEEKKINDAFGLYFNKKISREGLVSQLVQITGKSTDEIKTLLRNSNL